MGIDLQDSFNRLFNAGNYEGYKTKQDEKTVGGTIGGMLENLNPVGKTWGEHGVSMGNPLFGTNEDRAKYSDIYNKGEGSEIDKFMATRDTFDASNPIGRNTKFEKQRQGWSDDKATQAGAATSRNTAGAILAAIFGGSALAGSGAGGASGATGATGATGASSTLTPTMGASQMGTGAGGLGVSQGSAGMGSVGLTSGGSEAAAGAGAIDWGKLASTGLKLAGSSSDQGSGKGPQTMALDTPTVQAYSPQYGNAQAIQDAAGLTAAERAAIADRMYGIQ